MNCPTEGTVLQLAERHGIEIDYCPSCRGVWLDRGELDKIIERVDGSSGGSPAARRSEPRGGRDFDDDDDRYDRRTEGGGRKRKPGGFLGELFELGG